MNAPAKDVRQEADLQGRVTFDADARPVVSPKPVASRLRPCTFLERPFVSTPASPVSCADSCTLPSVSRPRLGADSDLAAGAGVARIRLEGYGRVPETLNNGADRAGEPP